MQIVQKNSVVTISSLQVADMIEMRHKDLLRKINNINDVLAKRKITPSNYWYESTYLDKNNSPRKCYYVTQKGCELIAHKLNSERGIIFTTKYIDLFHSLKNDTKKELTTSDILQLAVNEINKLQNQLVEVTDRKDEVTQVLETIQTYGDNLLFREFVKIVYNDSNITISEKEFRNMLKKEKYIDSNNYPYARYKKYFNVNKGVKNGRAYTTTRLSAKGQLYFTNKLIKMFQESEES